MQLALWIWHFLEPLGLKVLASHPRLPKALYALWATFGIAFIILFSRGMIFWARSQHIGEPLTRRVVVGCFLVSILIFSAFRVKSQDWFQDNGFDFYKKFKFWTFSLAMPFFIISVLKTPLTSDVLSVGFATLCASIVDIPLVGLAIGALSAAQLIFSTFASSIGLICFRDR